MRGDGPGAGLPIDADLVDLLQTGVALLRRLVREEARLALRHELGAGNVLPGDRVSSECQPLSWLTPAQIADELNVAVATVWSWIRSGALAASQPRAADRKGRLYFVRREAVDDFLASSRIDVEEKALQPAKEAARILGRLAARGVRP